MKHTFHSLLKSPGFTAVAVTTLALGIGLNVSMFSLMNGLLFRPLNLPQADALIRVFRTTPQSPKEAIAPATFLDLQQQSADFARLAAFRLGSFAVAQSGEPPELLTGLRVTDGFFEVAGVQPELGRTFTAAEDQPGQNQVAVLSYAAWQQRFGGDAGVIGRMLRIDGARVTIVGVMPKLFHDPRLWGPAEIFRPMAMTAVEKNSRTENSLQVIGRCAAGIGIAQINARLAAVAATLAHDYPDAMGQDFVRAVTLRAAVQKKGNAMMTLLLIGLAGFVLLIACANLANLQLTRAAARSREFAIRAALGASRRRLLEPVIQECLVLAATGGALGLLFAAWLNAWISHVFATLGEQLSLSLDGRVLLFAGIVSGLTGLAFGLVPAWLTVRVTLNHTLKSGGAGSIGDRSQTRFRSLLVVAQFALALMLLTTAGLFIRGVNRLMESDHGWNLDRVVQGTIHLPESRFADAEARIALYTQLEERLGALPGAESATVAWSLPIFGFNSMQRYLVAGRAPLARGEEPLAFVNGVSPSYFRTTGVKLVAGRGFATTDRLDAAPVVLINESMARALFPNVSPLGQRISQVGPEAPRWMEIVGVVGDVTELDPESPATPFQLYRPLAQEPSGYATVAVRVHGDATSLAEPIRRAIAELEPDLPVRDLATVASLTDRWLVGFNLINSILGGFAALGLFLAMLGVYGVVARTVVQRTPEIGVRLALGAQMHDIMNLILAGGIRLAIMGAGVGLAGTYGIAQAIGAAIPLFPQLEPSVTALLALTLVAVGMLACYLPARRAAKVDPLHALRAE